MIELQLHKKQSHYAKNEKDLAKIMSYHSAACYTRLRKTGLNLPTESTVRDWIAEYDVLPGTSSIIFKQVEENLKKMPGDERVCALKYDEMKAKRLKNFLRNMI